MLTLLLRIGSMVVGRLIRELITKLLLYQVTRSGGLESHEAT